MSEATKKDESGDNAGGFNLWIFPIVLALVVGAWFFYLHWVESHLKLGERGIFGDMFGGLNALFSGLAFAGVICTIFLQSKELKLQREEMEKFAKAQKGSEQALKAQAETLEMTAKLNAMNSILINYEPILLELQKEKEKISKTRVSSGGQETEESGKRKKAVDGMVERINKIHMLRKKILFDLEEVLGSS